MQNSQQKVPHLGRRQVGGFLLVATASRYRPILVLNFMTFRFSVFFASVGTDTGTPGRSNVL